MGTRMMEAKQGILFSLDCPLRGNIRAERSVMDFPFFGLEKRPQNGTIEHRIGDTTITIRAGETGIATMYDKEILLYIGSLAADAIRRGGEISQEFTFTAHDFFRVTGTGSPGSREYARFNDAMTRLQGTQVQTNVKAGGRVHRGWFSWVESASAVYDTASDGTEKLRAVKVRICDFVFKAIQKDGQMYSIHHDYFQLGLIERRLYEIARSHCDDGPFEIDLEMLHRTVGSKRAIRKFKQDLLEIEAGDRLPQYSIKVEEIIEGNRRRAKPTETIITFSEKASSSSRRALSSPIALLAA